MIENFRTSIIAKHIILVVITLIFVLIGELLFGSYLRNSGYIQAFFFILIIIDLLAYIIFIVKNFSILGLIILIVNMIVKFMYIIIYVILLENIIYVYETVLLTYWIVMGTSVIIYPIFILVFMIKTYKNNIIKVDKTVLMLLVDGLFIFLLQFLVKFDYEGHELQEYVASIELSHISWLVILLILVAIYNTIYPFKESELKEIEKV